MKPPHGLAEIERVFGEITVHDGAVATAGWENRSMQLFAEPWMPKGHLYVNKNIWPALKASFENCIAFNDGYKIKTLGCFAPRLKRVNGELSTHSFGIAVDLNADDNPLQKRVPGVPIKMDIPQRWIAEFEANGFTWGGNFSGHSDPQHFQWCSGY